MICVYICMCMYLWASICVYIFTEYMCFIQIGDISTLNGSSLKLVDKFTYLGSSVSSTKTDINTRLAKARSAIDRLSVIWKSDLTDKMKRSFLQAVVVSILLYECTTWTLTKRMEKKLDGNYTRMLWAILNKSWRQHPQSSSFTSTYLPLRKLSKLDEPDMQDTAGEVGTNSQMTYICEPLHVDEQRQDDQLEPTYNSSVRIQDVALKTYWEWRTIKKGGGRGSGRSKLAVWHEDDDMCIYGYIHIYKDICIYIYIYMYMYMCAYTHKYVCIYIYICIYIYVYTYVYTHVYILHSIYMCVFGSPFTLKWIWILYIL